MNKLQSFRISTPQYINYLCIRKGARVIQKLLQKKKEKEKENDYDPENENFAIIQEFFLKEFAQTRMESRALNDRSIDIEKSSRNSSPRIKQLFDNIFEFRLLHTRSTICLSSLSASHPCPSFDYFKI